MVSTPTESAAEPPAAAAAAAATSSSEADQDGPLNLPLLETVRLGRNEIIRWASLRLSYWDGSRFTTVQKVCSTSKRYTTCLFGQEKQRIYNSISCQYQ